MCVFFDSDASRISARVQIREYVPAGPNHAKHFQNLPHNVPKSIQKPSKTSQHPPQIFPESSKIDSKGLWTPFLTYAWKKVDLEHPKHGPKAPRSAQKTA